MKLKFTNIAILKILLLSLALLLALSVRTVNAKHIVVYGDSLSAAYGMELEQGWVHLLSESLGKDHKITNASISGETSSGGLGRLPLTLNTFKPDVVLIELGANDALRGLPTSIIKTNLQKMVSLIMDSGAKAIIAGISIPASYGPRYIDEFRAIFPSIASENNIGFFDLYNEDFINKPGYIQNDGLHPTPLTQNIIKNSVETYLIDHKLIQQP